MKYATKSLCTLAATFVLACAYNPPPVPVIAAPADLARLVGTWNGDYSAATGERTGSIVFHLTAGRDTANGDVVMIPRDLANESQFGVRGAALPHVPQALSITFVRVNNREIAGKLNPYDDPDLGCRVESLFRGAFVTDSTLGGTFITRDMTGEIVRRGSWNAARAGRKQPRP